MQEIMPLRHFILSAIDTYRGVKTVTNPVRDAQLNKLNDFCQLQRMVSDESIRCYVEELIHQINAEVNSRWRFFSSKQPSRLVKLLARAIHQYDRQITVSMGSGPAINTAWRPAIQAAIPPLSIE